jgi:L-ribulose-5-phosphate 3-epimerase
VPFGEGVVDFERCFETLKQTGYCGPYLIEMWSETSATRWRRWRSARLGEGADGPRGLMEAA